MKIKAATKKDFNTVIELDEELCLYERKFDPFIKTGKVERKSVRESLNLRNTKAFIATERKDTLGFIMGYIERKPFYAVNRGYICDIYIEKKYRHKGIGEALMEHMLNWFKKRRINDIELNVYSKNIKALKIYKHLGFKEFDKVMRLKI